MFTTAAAAAFTFAGTAAVSAISTVSAIVSAAVAFPVKVAVKKCFAFSAGKNFLRLFIKTQAGRSVTAFFIYTVVADKVAVGNFLSAFSGNGDAVRNKIMSPSAVFTFAFMFHRVNPFHKNISG